MCSGCDSARILKNVNLRHSLNMSTKRTHRLICRQVGRNGPIMVRRSQLDSSRVYHKRVGYDR
jgi:hypothetical protein